MTVRMVRQHVQAGDATGVRARALAASGIAMAAAIGCAVVPPAADLPLSAALAPVSFGASAVWQQRIAYRGNAGESEFDAIVEIAPRAITMVITIGSLRALTVVLNEAGVSDTRHLPLGRAVDGTDLLRHMQMIYWPLPALRAALAPRWSVQEVGALRLFLLDGVPRITVEYSDPQLRVAGRAVLQRRGYQLVVDSVPVE